jgi:phosphate uptake regulator
METADLSHHISRRFNEDLERVRNKVLTMGGMVEQQLANAVTALIEGDSNLGTSVARDDFKVNGMEMSIDEECSRILATRAPAAGDLRVVVAIIKTITDLERIGDEGEKIGYIASRLATMERPPTSTARSSISAASSRRWCTRRSTPSRAWTPRPRCAWRARIAWSTRNTNPSSASASRS